MRPAFSHCFLKRLSALSKDSFSFSFTPGKRSPSFASTCRPREPKLGDHRGGYLAASVVALPSIGEYRCGSGTYGTTERDAEPSTRFSPSATEALLRIRIERLVGPIFHRLGRERSDQDTARGEILLG